MGQKSKFGDRMRLTEWGLCDRAEAPRLRILLGEIRGDEPVGDEPSQSAERLVAENLPEVIWLRLRRLTSFQLCRKVIERRTTGLESDVIDLKAKGMAWAIRSALGYWDTKPGDLNAKILSRYYALLQISIAEQIASNDPSDTLVSIQRHTEFGHGLFTLQNPNISFPESYLVGCLGSGHFAAYTKKLGVDLSAFSFKSKPRKFDKLQPQELGKLLSLSDLMRRVPELQGVTSEYFGKSPLSFQIASNTSRNLRKMGQVVFDLPPKSDKITTYVSIIPHGYDVSAEELNSYGFPIKNIVKETEDPLGNNRYFVGEIQHEPPNWWKHVETYKSGYCGTSIVVPFWGTVDMFLLHILILYATSIIVRYLPEKWHEIEDGDLDHFHALFDHYMVIVDNVLPKIVIERLTGVKLLATQPGSLDAPI